MANRRDYAGGAAATTISTGINATDLTIILASSSGWPVGTNGKFFVSIDAGLSTEEKILVTSRSGTTLTIASTGDRGVDGTIAQTHSSSAPIIHCGTATDLDEANAHVTDTTRNDHTQYFHKGVDEGAGLVVNGTAVDVHVDNSSIEINADTLRVKAGGITQAMLAAAVWPAGTILHHSGGTAPTGWLLADGAAVSRTTYAGLFAVCGTTYGAGDGSTTFNVPNGKGKTLVGKDAGQTEFAALGQTGGEKTHVLSSAEMAGHVHTVDPPITTSSTIGAHDHATSSGALQPWYATVSGTGNVGAGSNAALAPGGRTSSDNAHSHTVDIASFSSGAAGSDTAHNNLQPYLVVNHIVKT